MSEYHTDQNNSVDLNTQGGRDLTLRHICGWSQSWTHVCVQQKHTTTTSIVTPQILQLILEQNNQPAASGCPAGTSFYQPKERLWLIFFSNYLDLQSVTSAIWYQS